MRRATPYASRNPREPSSTPPTATRQAVQLMNNADEYATRKHVQKKPLIAVARDAVQTAEDARAIAVKKMDDVRLANERQASADAQAQSQAQADDATRRRDQAEADTARAQSAAARAQSDMAASQAATAAAVTAAQTDADQSRLAAQQAQQNVQDAQQNAQQAQQNAQQAESDKAAMRALWRAVEYHSPDSRHRTRPPRQHVRRIV